MKILSVHSIWEDPERMSSVDQWRIQRPLRELSKHVDWQIDAQPSFIKGIEKYKDENEFTVEELEKAAEFLGQYDIVFSSYFADHTPYTLMKVVEKRYGTKLILDFDDNMFAVNEDNPFWTKVGDRQVWWMQNMIKDCPWITTTTEDLANEFRRRREQDPSTVVVLPNLMPNDYQHPPFNNDPWIVIGYFGGASHFYDLNDTQIMPAIEQIMHEYRNVRFKTVGIPSAHYIPTKRHDFVDGKRGTGWITDVFPTLAMDIAVAPLLDNIFNYGKSDIKWQEATRMGSAFVASNIGPYSKLGDVALLCENTHESWYNTLKKLVEDAQLRKSLVAKAQKQLTTQTLEGNWEMYKTFFERVHNG